LLGLCGHEPDVVDVDAIDGWLTEIHTQQRPGLMAHHTVAFTPATDLALRPDQRLPFHTNALRFSAFQGGGELIDQRTYYSVGGGFVVSEELAGDAGRHGRVAPPPEVLPCPFHSAEELLRLTREQGLTIAQ